jgi:ubiquinone/menaquinone biosynthesis C-methylase UbiE
VIATKSSCSDRRVTAATATPFRAQNAVASSGRSALRKRRETSTVAERPVGRESFDNVANVYDEIRPGYPRALYADLCKLLPPRPLILEVGPGTGQATRGLLAEGALVDAVEIGPAMAAKLREVLPSDHLTVIAGDFEQVPRDGRRYDAIFSATAYHWIGSDAQLERPARLLKAGGVIAVADLVQVDSSTDHGFFGAVQPIYERYGQGHTGPAAPKRDQVEPKIRQSLQRDPRYSNVMLRTYDWDQTYSASGYRKLVLSYSGTQMMKEPARTALVDDMEHCVRDRFDDRVTRPLVVALTTATLVG